VSSDAERIAKLEARVADLEKVIGGLRALFTGSTGDAASDRELDAQHGDPDVRFVPRSWTSGGVVKGQRFSRCPPDFLDLLAETYDFFAEKNDAEGAKAGNGKPKSLYDRRSAKLARGWARRIRAGWTPPAVPTLAGAGGFGSGPAPGASFRFGAGAPAFGGAGGPFGARTAAPPLAAPTEPAPGSEPPPPPDSDTSFNFGANVAPRPASEPALTDDALDDDEPPLA
jgi:hypothetical protein